MRWKVLTELVSVRVHLGVGLVDDVDNVLLGAGEVLGSVIPKDVRLRAAARETCDVGGRCVRERTEREGGEDREGAEGEHFEKNVGWVGD